MGALQMDGAGCFTIGDVPGVPGAVGVYFGKGQGMKTLIWAMLAAALCMGADLAAEEGKAMKKISREALGATPEGVEVDAYTLVNKHGMKARIMTYGGIVLSLEVPDRDGQLEDVTLGFDSLDGYVAEHPYFGTIVGRYANRIKGGRFVLDGVEYVLAQNNGPNHLHGGIKGFDKAVWAAEPTTHDGAPALRLRHVSPDGDEGYPGTLTTTVTYVLTDDNALEIHYEAETDRPTIVNLTQHAYFNLAGRRSETILDHEMQILASRYTPVDETLIPTGELRAVKDTPMDFTTPHRIGARIDQVEGGYDHNYVLDSGGGALALAARVHDPASGRVMEVHTTEPGLQFYTGNFLDGSIKGKGGRVYPKHAGFCLEAQVFPDSPNNPSFPSPVLRPGSKYTQTTVYRFLTE